MEEDDYGILEGFVYNYKTEKWLRYRKGDGGQAIESSFPRCYRLISARSYCRDATLRVSPPDGFADTCC